MKPFLFSVLLLACACTQRVYQMPVSRNGDDYECIEMLQKADNCTLAGKILAGVGGASALAAVPGEIPESGRWGIGAAAAATSTIGVGLIWYGERQEERFNEVCEYQDAEQPDGGTP